jgi:hypothetical protein
MEKPTLDEQFERYDRENPRIYRAFCRYTIQVIEARRKCAAKTVMERIRWDTIISGNDRWKINNNYSSRYARKFMRNYPQYDGFFATRELRS